MKMRFAFHGTQQPAGCLRGMRFFLTLLLVLTWSSSASAQSFFLQEGRLLSEGQDVGRAVHAAVQITAAEEDQVTLFYRGRRIVVEANIRLGESHLQVGATRDATLTDIAFQTVMLRAAWAPVLRMNETRVVVALPPGAPQAQASLARESRRARAIPLPDLGPWDAGDRDISDDEAFHCVGFTLAPTASSPPSFRPPKSAARHRLRSEGDFDVFAVTIEGFVFTGYRASTLPCVPEAQSFGLIGSGFGSGDGAGSHRVVVLNARTQLFATTGSTEAFATLRTRAYGIEIEVSDPSRFLVQVDDGRATFQLLGFLHVANSALRDAPRGHNGFGLSRTPMDDWPTG